MVRIGIDLGGTKIAAVALDASGQVLAKARLATPAGDYAATLQVVADLVFALEARLGARATVGIGTPGAVSPVHGVIKNSNSVCLNGKPLHHDLARVLNRPVRVANDADCFALSEATDGAGAGKRVVFGVIVGTGTGGGVVVDGRLLGGPNAIAGEWGHNPLPWPEDDERPGPACYCGKHGCIETFLSGPGLAADYLRATGTARSADQVVAAATSGEAAAQAVLARHVDRMARALASVINLLDPDCIVLGGGVSRIAALYTEVPRRWGRYVFSDRVDTLLVPPRFGAESGVRGAAWLWPLAEPSDQPRP